MAVQREVVCDLNTAEILAFVLDAGAIDYVIPFSLTGYSESGTPREVKPSPSTPVEFHWNHREVYHLLEGAGQVVGSVTINVPRWRSLTFTVDAWLYVRDQLDPVIEARIRKAFDDFDYNKHGDPASYAADEITKDGEVTSGDFEVVNRITLHKIGGFQERKEQRDFLNALNTDQAEGTYKPSPNGKEVHLKEANLFRKRKLSFVLRAEYDSGTLEPRPRDPNRNIDVIDQMPEHDQKKKIEEIAEGATFELKCEGLFETVAWRMFTIVRYPELRLTWRPVVINIGCGVVIVISVPVIEIQWTDLNVWAYWRRPSQSHDDLVKSAVEGCVFAAALAGTVVGLATLDIYAASAIFKGVLEECIYLKFGQYLKCFVPDLATLNEVVEPWH